MLHSLIKHLLDPVTETGGNTVVTTNVNTDRVGSTQQEPPPAKDPPAQELDKTFSVEDFPTAQLPTHEQLKGVNDKNKGQKTKKEEVVKETVVAEEPPVVTEVQKGVVPKTEEKLKTEEKKAEGIHKFLKPPVTDATKKTEVQPATTKQITVPQTGTRDYAGLTESQVSLMKQMSNPAYEFARELIKENKELSKLKDSTYLQHEHAYVLDPAYQAVQTDIQFAQREAEIYKQQLVLMRSGKPYRQLVEFNNDGTPKWGEVKQPTPENEEDVRMMLNSVVGIMQQKNVELQSYPTKYKQQVSGDIAGIQTELKNRFQWEADPKLQEHLLTVQYHDGPKDIPIKDIIKEFTSLFPPYMRSHPAVRVAANMNVAMIIGQAMLTEAQSGNHVAQVIEQEQSRVEPTAANGAPKVAKGAEQHGVKEFSLAGLPV